MYGIHRKAFTTFLQSIYERGLIVWIVVKRALSYGVPFYKAVGFAPTDEEKTVNGIRFTPMEYRIKGGN